MRKLLMIAGAAAMAVSMPALALEKGGGGGKPDKAEKADKGQRGGGHGGGGHGGGKPDKAHKAERGWAKQEFKAEKREFKAEQKFRKHEDKAEKKWAKSEAKAEKNWRKDEAKAEKQFAKQERRVREDDRRFRDDRRFADNDRRFRDDRDFRDGDRRFAGNMDGCPPGLAKKNNGCMPPGQAKKFFSVGERLPVSYLSSYNIPDEYRDWYQDSADYSYRYDDGNIFRVDNRTSLISSLIPLLGGGFGVGNILPVGFDAYNLPMQYRDDYQDSDQALYRYGDDAIYQVDPKTQMIQGVVALLAGNLNVGQVLPSGYDAYNLPMQYRDQYQDSDEAMYRYADNNIYQIDPKTQIIEQIVQMLV
jgi:hypothetical protein